MELQNLKRIREKYNNKNLIVVCDNVYRFYTDNKGEMLIWDDDNERCISIKMNENRYKIQNRSKLPVIIEAFDYDQIQYVWHEGTKEEFMTEIDDLLKKGLISKDVYDTKRKEFLDYINDRVYRN